jgi:hypothetical protein
MTDGSAINFNYISGSLLIEFANHKCFDNGRARQTSNLYDFEFEVVLDCSNQLLPIHFLGFFYEELVFEVAGLRKDALTEELLNPLEVDNQTHEVEVEQHFVTRLTSQRFSQVLPDAFLEKFLIGLFLSELPAELGSFEQGGVVDKDCFDGRL